MDEDTRAELNTSNAEKTSHEGRKDSESDVNPERKQRQETFSRRALLSSGWIAPVVLLAGAELSRT